MPTIHTFPVTQNQGGFERGVRLVHHESSTPFTGLDWRRFHGHGSCQL